MNHIIFYEEDLRVRCDPMTRGYSQTQAQAQAQAQG